MPKSKSLSDLLKQYKDHFSVLKINKIQNKFQFSVVSPYELRKVMQSLNKKSAISPCISVKHLTDTVDIYLPFFADIS